MSKQQKLSDIAYCKLKATKEREERKCAAFFHAFLQKKYVVKATCKDEDAERTSELGEEENVNMMNRVGRFWNSKKNNAVKVAK